MENVETVVSYNPISWIAWVLALPIRLLSWTIVSIKDRLYDPEEVICPACGFRGDSGTNGKSCSIRCIRTQGDEQAAIAHSCFRCSAEFYSHTFLPAKRWMSPVADNRVAQVKKVVAGTEL